MDTSFWLPAGAVILAAACVLFFYRRKREAEQQAQQVRQSHAVLSDLVVTEMAMKASQLESYKAMLRQANPQPQQPPPNRPRGIDWDFVKDGNPRRRF
jgi:hypothetical protein